MMIPLWFAWYPVKTDRGWRWLCEVERYCRMDDYGTSPPYKAKWHYDYYARKAKL